MECTLLLLRGVLWKLRFAVTFIVARGERTAPSITVYRALHEPTADTWGRDVTPSPVPPAVTCEASRLNWLTSNGGKAVEPTRFERTSTPPPVRSCFANLVYAALPWHALSCFSEAHWPPLLDGFVHSVSWPPWVRPRPINQLQRKQSSAAAPPRPAASSTPPPSYPAYLGPGLLKRARGPTDAASPQQCRGSASPSSTTKICCHA